MGINFRRSIVLFVFVDFDRVQHCHFMYSHGFLIIIAKFIVCTNLTITGTCRVLWWVVLTQVITICITLHNHIYSFPSVGPDFVHELNFLTVLRQICFDKKCLLSDLAIQEWWSMQGMLTTSHFMVVVVVVVAIVVIIDHVIFRHHFSFIFLQTLLSFSLIIIQCESFVALTNMDSSWLKDS